MLFQSARVQEGKSARVQEARVQEGKSTRVQEARAQEFKRARVQEHKRARVQELKSRKLEDWQGFKNCTFSVKTLRHVDVAGPTPCRGLQATHKLVHPSLLYPKPSFTDKTTPGLGGFSQAAYDVTEIDITIN